MATPHDTLLGLFAPEGRANPYPFYRRLLEQAPVAAIGSRRAVVTGYQESAEVLLNTRLFPVPDHRYADRLWPDWRKQPSTATLYGSLLFLNPPENQPARRLMARFFNPKRVQHIRPMIERHAAEQTASLVTGEDTADAARSFLTIPDAIMGEFLGVPRRDMGQLTKWLDMFLERNELHSPEIALEDADRATPLLLSYIREELLPAHADDETNLIASLVRQWDTCDERDLLSNLVFVLGAGTVTTSSLLGSGLLQLAKDNALLRRLRTDSALLRSFVLETVRHAPPIQYGARVAAEDTELGGTPIARDTLMLVCFGALGRDPEHFPNPDAFIADRFVSPQSDPRDILSFGLGTHRCAGADLALATGEIAFRELARRVTGLKLESPPQRQNRTVVRKFVRLEMRVSSDPAGV